MNNEGGSQLNKGERREGRETRRRTSRRKNRRREEERVGYEEEKARKESVLASLFIAKTNNDRSLGSVHYCLDLVVDIFGNYHLFFIFFSFYGYLFVFIFLEYFLTNFFFLQKYNIILTNLVRKFLPNLSVEISMNTDEQSQ